MFGRFFSFSLAGVLTLCGCQGNKGLSPNEYEYGKDPFSLFSDSGGNDPLAKLIVDVDENYLFFKVTLNKAFETLFFLSSLEFRKADFYWNDERPLALNWSGSIFDPLEEFGSRPEDSAGEKIDPFLGLSFQGQSVDPENPLMSFEAGINEIRIPLSNDDWHIDYSTLEVVINYNSNKGAVQFFAEGMYLSSEWVQSIRGVFPSPVFVHTANWKGPGCDLFSL